MRVLLGCSFVLLAAACQDSVATAPGRGTAIGGTVSGLAGQGLVLQNNGSDDLDVSSNSTFWFPTRLQDGTYNVTVSTQPTNPTQTCTVSAGSGAVGASDVATVVVNCASNTFTVGGTVTGLTGNLVLENSNGEHLTVSADGTFAFPTALVSGASYRISIASQPDSPAQYCTVAGGTGMVGGSDVTSVMVACATNSYPITGELDGMSPGVSIVISDNGSDELTLNANGGFAFPTALTAGSTYDVAIVTQPTGAQCAVKGGSGVVGPGGVDSVEVSCACFTFTNDANQNLTDNNWFNACANAAGNTVVIDLRDAAGNDVYHATGQKNGTWSPPNDLTSTAAAGAQYNSANHDRLITLTNGDQLMIPGQASQESGCGGSLGNGYAIVVYQNPANYYQNIKMLVAPYDQYVGGTTARSFGNWTPDSEISWAGGALMDSCNGVINGVPNGPLVPFNGTFSFAVGP